MDEEIALLWFEWGRQIRALPADDPMVKLLLAFPLWALALVTTAFHQAWGGD